MIAVLRAELVKMRALKKVYAAFATVALIPLFVFVTLLVLYLRSRMSVYGANMLLAFNQGVTLKTMLGGYFAVLKTFSWIAWVFVMMLVGETVSKEFQQGTLKTLLVQPVRRTSIYAGKFAAVVLAYFAMLAVYVACFAASGLLLKYGFGTNLGTAIDLGIYLKLFGAGLVIDLTWIALAFLVACVASSDVTVITYNLLAVMFLNLLEASLRLLITLRALEDPVTKFLLDHSFAKTTGVLAFDKMETFITNPTATFPARFDDLFTNALWGAFFLLAGALLFLRREARS